jgi:hypothetical protein
MAKSFQRLASLLGQPSHDYRPSARQFLSLNTEKLKNELRLVDRGERNGARNEPASDATALDSVEREVIQRIEDCFDEADHIYQENMQSYARRLSGQSIAPIASAIRATTPSATANFLAEIQAGRGLLEHLRDEVTEAERAYHLFRRRHNINRTAHYPDSKLLHYGLLTAIMLGEAILNGIMLARGHELGLLGGVGTAFMIALLNVFMLGFSLGGSALRFLHHRSPSVRGGGFVTLICAVALVIAFNLLVAHYRDALGSPTPEEAGFIAIASLTNSPLGIADAQSWFLFVAGCCFACVGAFDHLKTDDPYPGFGKLARQRQRLRDDFEAAKSSLIQDLQDERDVCVETAQAARDEIARRLQETNDVLTARNGHSQAYRSYIQHLEKTANDLLKLYREANRGNRSTLAPAYFAETWSSQRRAPDLDGTADPNLQEAEKIAREASDDLETVVKRVNKDLTAALAAYGKIARDSQVEANDG